LVAVIALIIALVALASSSSGASATAAPTMSGMSGMQGMSGMNGTGAPSGAAKAVTMSFKTDVEHGKRGRDGQWHDAAIPALITVHAGDRVTVTAYNYDSSPHSFTAPTLNTNQIIPGGSASNPSQAKFTFTAPAKPGRYQWWCSVPCDPYSMAHVGFMRGYVTVKA
jgi:plastocyanin